MLPKPASTKFPVEHSPARVYFYARFLCMKIDRRHLLHLAGGACLAWNSPSQGQQAKVPLVAVLLPATFEFAHTRTEALRKGLREAGLTEGTDFKIVLRYAEGRTERLPELARELQAASPAVMVLGAT